MTGLRRRALLRALLGTAVAGTVAGCNDGGGDPGTGANPDDSTDGTPTGVPPGSPAPTAPPSAATATSTPSPTATLPPPSPADTPTPSSSPTPSPSPTLSPSPTQSPTPDRQTRTAREFVGRLAAGEFAGAHDLLTDDYASDLTPVKLERYWLGLTAQHGAFERVAGTERGRRDGAETVVARVACGQGTGRVELAVLADGVDALWFPATYSPPDYVDRSAFTERDLVVDAEGCSLPATLSVPDATDESGTATPAASPPGAVLVHGSGQADRDETVGPNKPLRDLAWGLASRGVAVLRYEKRTAQCDVPLSDWGVDHVVVDDAVRALARLRDTGDVDPAGTVIVGHSLGGTCTPRILARDGDAAGGAMLAANARPITEVSMDQVRHYYEIPDGISVLEQRRIDRLRAAFDRLEAGGYAPDRVVEGFPASWWTSLLEYDQVATAQSVDVPLFLAQGGRDFQVLADADFGRWRSVLADRADTRFERYPALSHLFHPGTAPSLREEYTFHDNVAESLVADLAEWIRDAVG